ncbi:MAG: FtsQ-type POTRA domain-containing protein [Negativicutes bacterium]|nr:FtsQ-type POTRA domain-containing protein [Negativicutes bacterium]
MGTVERLKEDRQPARKIPAPAFVMLLLILAALIAGFLFLRSTYFTVGSVVIEGNKFLTVDDVNRAADIPEKINIFRLDTSEIKSRLLRDLRVAEVNVTRRFPATIVISLTERQPLAYVANSFGFVQLDKQGVVLVALKNIKQVNVPIITGVRLGSIYVGDKVETIAVKNALVYLAALDEDTINQLSEINIKSNGDLLIYTVQAFTIRLGNGEKLADKAKMTNDILRELGDKKTAVDYIDLNYASPYIKFRQR